MYQINFKKPCTVHFIGIGGISMSGLAEILLKAGFLVSGSDSNLSDLTKRLETMGAVIFEGQRASNIRKEVDVVVYTAAIHEDNEELRAAREKAVALLSRAELLGQIMKNYDTAVAISGTHGKTSTTSMVAQILLEGDKDPTISVGGILKSIGGNLRVGSSDIFVTEACEYTNSFLSFYPTVAAILNVEADHLDFFENLADIRHSFRLFAKKLPEEGLLVINKEISNYQEITKGLPCRVVTFGLTGDSDYYGKNLAYDQMARASFDVTVKGKDMGRVFLSVPGEHNVRNALAAIAIGMELSVPMERIKSGLKRFTGTNRRFEKKGEVNGITIIDDYAHHPDEIVATLKAAKNYPHKKLFCLFQPHTYTRTKAFMEEFAAAFTLADEVILADIYAARETDTLGMSSRILKEKMEKIGIPTHYFSSFSEIESFILQHCEEGDLLITMGAGNIVNVGENLLRR